MSRSMRALNRQREEELSRNPVVLPRARAERIVNAVVPQNSVDGYVREIDRLWQEASDKFIAIGEYLIEARETLPHGDYEAMVRGRLPFSLPVARKLRAVAEAVRNKRIPRESLPRSYATAYELTLLTDQELVVAKRRSLVRPDVQRRQILELRTELRAPTEPQYRHSALYRERESLEREIVRIRERLAQIAEELSRLDQPIVSGKPAIETESEAT